MTDRDNTSPPRNPTAGQGPGQPARQGAEKSIEQSPQPRLSVRDLGFSYGSERFRLSGVSFDVAPGELVGLLGANGSGKSTIVRLVMRLMRAHQGGIIVDGKPSLKWHMGDYARRVAYVPQESRAVFAFTALETVLMGRSPHTGMLGFESEDDIAAARGALQTVDAEIFADTLLEELSGGERQRVILARALAQQANLLVLDEPAAFLDIRHQYDLYRLLRDLSHLQGRSCLCVSHDLNVAAAYCDKLLLMHAGRLLAQGTPAEVLTSDLIRTAYDIEADVVLSPTGRPTVLPRVE